MSVRCGFNIDMFASDLNKTSVGRINSVWLSIKGWPISGLGINYSLGCKDED